MQVGFLYRGESSRQNELIKEVRELRREVQQIWERLSQTPQDWIGIIGGGTGPIINLIGGSGSGSGMQVVTAVSCSGGTLTVTAARIIGDFQIIG